MGKITPNFADKQKTKRNGTATPPAVELHVEAAHEPLKGSGNWAPGLYSFPNGPALQLPLVQTTGVAVPVAPAPPLKVALIGTAPSSRMLAPFNDPSWKIWACSPGNMGQLPRHDAWFEVHSNLLWPEHESYGKPYTEWLKGHTTPVYVLDPTVLPNGTLIPWSELVADFGGDFFTSSFAWMMALAIRQGATEIALYGIDMASRDEYILQRPGFFFFRHEARRRGIKVSAPNESDIMQSPPLYGISDSTPFGRKLFAREQEIKQRLGGMTQQRDNLSNQITYLQGALEDVDYFKSIWSGAQSPAAPEKPHG